MIKKSSDSSLPLTETRSASQTPNLASIDAAVAKGGAGKALLPESLHAAFDLIQQAFTHYEAGRDEDARAALQGIGLQSPLLEWKLLLRGLIAYAASDDTRALENWQRLDSKRLPYRLCAAVRGGIDPPFLHAQSATVQQALRARRLQSQGAPIASPLRELREALHEKSLAPAFRKAQSIFPYLQTNYPELATRLRQVFAWAIIHNGHPRDIERYLHTFGAAPDDPKLNRLQALALEARGMLAEAHKGWQAYIKDIADSTMAGQAQALIWARMAENAIPERMGRNESLNTFLRAFTRRPAPLKPNAEQCFEKSIKLWPEQLATHRALVRLYVAIGNLARARKVAEQLLKRHPNDVDTLVQLADAHVEERDYAKALDYLDRAIALNPLDRDLPALRSVICQHRALELTLDGDFEGARACFERALKYARKAGIWILCRWALSEAKAKNTARSEELLREALAAPDHRLACKYALMSESVRVMLPAAQKKQFVADFKAALAEAPTTAEVLMLLEAAAYQRAFDFAPYTGQKAHEKMVLKAVESVEPNALTEVQMERLVENLEFMEARKPWLRCLTCARRRFLKNPYVRLSLAQYYLEDRLDLAREYLDEARRLAQALPGGEAQQRLLERIQMKEQVLAAIIGDQAEMMEVVNNVFGGYDED